jgi:hypothetical protein
MTRTDDHETPLAFAHATLDGWHPCAIAFDEEALLEPG